MLWRYPNDIEQLCYYKWFISDLINLNRGDSNPLKIFEQGDAFLSIIDSLRHSKIIIHPNVSKEYFNILCNKWYVPIWLQNESKDLLLDGLNKTNSDIQKCSNCKLGFSKSNNTSKSCRSHPGYIRNSKWTCCGSVFDEDNDNLMGCIYGCHIACNIEFIEILRMLAKFDYHNIKNVD